MSLVDAVALSATAPSFRLLLPTARVSDATRTALEARLAQIESAPDPQFFAPATFATLCAVCEALLPESESRFAPIVAMGIDKRLSEGDSDGWRYDTLPPDADVFGTFLRDMNAASNGEFSIQPLAARRALLEQFKNGLLPVSTPPRFFEDLIAEVVENFYSFPSIQDAIGYDGYADVISTFPRTDTPIVSPTLSGSETVDAVVIGTGAGGAPILMRLAQAGYKVVALEAGTEWNPARDFATDERAQKKLFWNSERLSAGKDAVAFGNNNSGTGVGGSTLHFTAYTPRPHPDDFTIFTDYGVGADWPLRFEDLEPYIEEVEQFLGISGPAQYPWGAPRRKDYPLGPLPLNAPARLMETGCKSLGIGTSPAPNAALSQPYFQKGVGWRAACTNRGFCQAGCSTGAKGSTDVTFIPVARAVGADVRPGCFVTEIERDRTGRVSSVVYEQDGKMHRLTCKAVFLCAGAVESPRLLLLNGIGNGSGQVGRNFMAHPGVQVWGQFEPETVPWRGIPGGLISEDYHRAPDAGFMGGYLLQSIGVMPLTYASQFVRGTQTFGDDLHRHMQNFRHVAGINILGEGLPYEHNYLELSDEKDERGLPKPRVYYTAGENEKKITAHGAKIMRQIWEAAGAHDIWEFQRFAHTLGTCRMGADAASSVVSADGAVWDVPGLYVCDNSVLPSSLAVNPSLTQMALSLRVADRFITQAKRGEG